MISRFKFGNPINTTAIIKEIICSDINDLKVLKYKNKENQNYFYYKMKKNDAVFGLGETLGSLNKRGKIYRMYSSDDPLHTPEKQSLYCTTPFFIVDGIETFGVLIDYPGEFIIDIGFENKDLLKININDNNFDLYIFYSNNKFEIIKEYLELTGRPHPFPKWSFGFQQSKWSYPDEKTINEIADTFREKEIPCDAVYMDIDYMDNFKVFTVDNNKFKDFKNFVDNMSKKGFKLVPIVDPGVKIEKNYDIYEEGVKNHYFCKDNQNNDFTAAIWPGYSHFPDFSNKRTRDWWGEKYSLFTNVGIKSFWNDMNEPAIFFTDKSIEEVFELADNINKNKNKAINPFEIKDKILGLANNKNDYKSFYHKDDLGNKINHDKIHNLYGYNMLKATSDKLKELIPNERFFLLTRSNYTGGHRYGSIWMGDNMSWWEHIIENIRMLQSLNITGFFYTGADIGGFSANTSPELLTRWMQLGVFSPLYRNHSALMTRAQEPWAFDNETENIIKNTIKLRYSILPYSYSEYMKSIINLKPFIIPLHFLYNTQRTKSIEDQYMYGESLMVCPIYIQNAKGRFVHLPENKWLLWNVSEYNIRQMKIYSPGDYYIESDISQIPIFIKENKFIVLSEPQNYVEEKKIDEITLIGLITQNMEFEIYDDDGKTYEYQKNHSKIIIKIDKLENNYNFNIEIKNEGNFKNNIKIINFEIYNEKNYIFKKQYLIQ